jgi:hypothetical protein
MHAIPLDRSWNKGFMKIGITQFGCFVIFLLILQDYRSAKKVKMVFLKKIAARPDLNRPERHSAGPARSKLRARGRLAVKCPMGGARRSATRATETVRGIGSRPIKGRSTAPAHLLPLATTDTGKTLAGASGHRGSPRGILRGRRQVGATRRTPATSTRGGTAESGRRDGSHASAMGTAEPDARRGPRSGAPGSR